MLGPRRMRGFVAALALGASLTLGCTLPELDLESRNCPCATGWTCNADDICVRGSNRIDAGADTGADSGSDVDLAIDTPIVDVPAGDASVDVPTQEVVSDAATDMGIDAPVEPASVCEDPPAGTIYCTGFEEPISGWIPEGELGRSEVVVGDAFAGTKFLRSSTSAEGLNAHFERQGLGNLTTGEFSARIYFRPAAPLQHFNFVSISELVDPFEGFALVVTETVLQAYSQPDNRSAFTPNAIRADEWNCAEFTIVIADVGGSVDFSLNGGTRVRVPSIDTRVASGYESLGLGVTFASPSEGPGDVDIDEFVIGRLPLPCD